MATALRVGGVNAIIHETNVDWERLFAHASEFKFILIDPDGWLERAWPHVLAAARTRRIEVGVCLPKSDGVALPIVAEQLHLQASEYKGRIEAAITSMSDSWRAA